MPYESGVRLPERGVSFSAVQYAGVGHPCSGHVPSRKWLAYLVYIPRGRGLRSFSEPLELYKVEVLHKNDGDPQGTTNYSSGAQEKYKIREGMRVMDSPNGLISKPVTPI